MRRNMRVRIVGNKTGVMNGYVLSPFGNIDGIGNFSDFAVITPTGPGAFTNSWTYDDWTSVNHKWKDHIAYWFKLDYEPLDSGVLAKASANGDKLNANGKLGDVQAGALLLALTTPIYSLIKQADLNTSQFDNLGNASDATHQARYNIFNNLNAAITKMANTPIPAFTPPPDDLLGTGSAPTGVLPGSTSTNAYVYQAQQLQLQAAQKALDAANKAATDAAKAAAAAAASNNPLNSLTTAAGSSTNLLVFGGIGLVALLGIGIFISKGKKS